MFGVCTKCGNATILTEPCPTCGESPPAPQRAAMAQPVMARSVAAGSAESDDSGQSLDVEAMVAEINASVAAESRTPSMCDHAKMFIVIGGFILAFAAAWAVQNLMFLRTAQPVTGIAISAEESYWSRGRIRTVNIVRYQADGQTFETSARNRVIGEDVELLISPHNPGNACVHSASALWSWPIFLTVVGGALLLLGVTRMQPPPSRPEASY
jgi:hypothetical protein